MASGFLTMSQEKERREIQRLYANYQAAENIIREKKYKAFVEKNCRDTVLDLKELALHRDFNTDKGKCVFIYVVKKQAKSMKAGLFEMSGHVFSLNFLLKIRANWYKAWRRSKEDTLIGRQGGRCILSHTCSI